MFKVFAFDFDGVLAKNTKELVLLCRRAWERMGRDASRISNSDIEKYRPLIRNALDWFGLLSLLDGKKPVSPSSIADIRARYPEESKKFSELFFGERYVIQEKDFDGWLELVETFDFVIKAVKDKAAESSVYIVSSKDRKTIMLLLERMGINIDKERVFGKEFSLDKRKIIRRIMDIEGVSGREVLFIDDSIEQLKSVMEMGTAVVMASWGYTTEEYVEEARNMGIFIADENNLRSILTEEYFDIVDENDNIVGKAARKECHSNPKLIHRGVDIIITNSGGQILLQKRGMKKDLYPGMWTCSATGHNDVGESYQDAAERELEEELGIKTRLSFLCSYSLRSEAESENLQIFTGMHDGPFHPNTEEVDEVKFFDISEARKLADAGNNVTPGFIQAFGEYLKYSGRK